MHSARLERSPRLQRVHAFLADGLERSTVEIITGACVLFFGLNWRGFPEFFRSVRDDSSRFALI